MEMALSTCFLPHFPRTLQGRAKGSASRRVLGLRSSILHGRKRHVDRRMKSLATLRSELESFSLYE
jgi:hypothetical protein